MDIDGIKKDYIKNSIIHGDIANGRLKVNRAAKELIKLNDYLKENEDIAKVIIDELLYSSNFNTQIWISGLALDLSYRKEEVIVLLKSLGNNKEIGILAMNARLRLADKKIVPIDSW